MNVIRVLLADDHQLVRAGLQALLNAMPGVEVVGCAEDGRKAIDLVREKHPAVALLDIDMPGLNGLEAARRLRAEFPRLRVVILSVHDNEEYVRQALRAGAAGYLLKDAAPAELALALQAVARGETYLSPAISRRVIEDYLRGVPDASTTFERLTPRQREILQLIAEGRSTKDIARLLDLGVKTVETHRAALMQALDIHEVAGLVRYALRHGLVNPDK